MEDRDAPSRAPRSSDVLVGRYVLEERIAAGGMAAVWRAHDETLARTVAVKILHADLSRDKVVRERFRREAVAAAKLVHPNIVSLFDTGEDEGHVFIVIEYIEGRTLADALQDGPLEVSEAARIGEAVARALQHAHQHDLVHRDVKPANILLATDGSVKVTDFGIAKAAQDATITATGRVMGTAAYVAPEQLREQPVDGRADLYSLGLVLYEALTGRRAFPGADPVAVAEARLSSDPPRARDVRADIPREMDDLIGQLLAADPEARPQAREVALDLAVFRRVEAPPLPSELPSEPAEESLRQELRWLIPVGALLLLAGALVAVGIFGGVIGDGRVASLFAEEVTPTPTSGPAQTVGAGDDRDAEATGDGDSQDAAPVRVPIARVVAFDPQGDDEERDSFLGNVRDGAEDTEWATERYNTPSFGNLKTGVGFYLDLSGAHTLTQVTLTVPRGGFDVELRVAGQVADEVAGWVEAAAVDDIESGQVTVALPQMPRARFLLVWITGDLQPFEGQFRAEIGEVEVEALG